MQTVIQLELVLAPGVVPSDAVHLNLYWASVSCISVVMTAILVSIRLPGHVVRRDYKLVVGIYVVLRVLHVATAGFVVLQIRTHASLPTVPHVAMSASPVLTAVVVQMIKLSTDNVVHHHLIPVVPQEVSHAVTMTASKPVSTTNGSSPPALNTNSVQESQWPTPESSAREPISVVQERRRDVIKTGFKHVSMVGGSMKLVLPCISVLILRWLEIPIAIARHRRLVVGKNPSILLIAIRMAWRSVIMGSGFLRNVIRQLSVWPFLFKEPVWLALELLGHSGLAHDSVYLSI